ncbi:MAG TPA: orotidine-5'-phosphate decarboxylase [Leucothrix mucor]|nr:orotidine-5'-phosphate decarboxylase [Leucothrix mucor]
MMSNKLIIALDFSSADEALKFVGRLSPEDCKLKVGFELFVSAGPEMVRKLINKGFDVFLDLKFHDIPNTVASVCRAAAKLDVWMMNVHASGGSEMMLAASNALNDFVTPPKLIAVSVLTSMSDLQLQETGVNAVAKDQVKHLASLAKNAGLDGMVCSAQEASLLREHLGGDFLLVTPGIRPQGADIGDQSRVMTPADAIRAGVDYIVVGRPITQSLNPLDTIQQINDEMKSALI